MEQKYFPSNFRKDLKQLSAQMPSYVAKCHHILAELSLGRNYADLGGKALRCRPDYVRFKLGQRYRLLVHKNGINWKPFSVISHERYNAFLKRRG